MWLGWACLTKKVHGPWHQGVCFDLCKMPQGIVECSRAVSTYTRNYTQKNIFWAPQRGFGGTFLYIKIGQNYFCRLTIQDQEPIFSVSNTEFEGGDDGHGHGDCTFFFRKGDIGFKDYADIREYW
jgi:hypothetical protein